jgi:hypothetical protein
MFDIRIGSRKKKPLRPRGQEGCVWLEKITDSLVHLPEGPRFASESLDADTQQADNCPTTVAAAFGPAADQSCSAG